MATEAGYRDVPLLLHPHTEALEAFLIPGAGEALEAGPNGTVPQQESALATPAVQQQQQQQQEPPQLFEPGDAMWVSPPALLSLREQSKQLQQQKRMKQKQHITMDSSPVRYELPRELQQHGGEQLPSPSGQGARSYTHTLVGASAQQQGTPTVSHRRERDGGVVVPLRMMSSLRSLAVSGAPRGSLTSPIDGGGGSAGGAAARVVFAAATCAAVGDGAAAAAAAGGLPQPMLGASTPQGSSALEPSDTSQPQPREQRHALPAEGTEALAAASPSSGVDTHTHNLIVERPMDDDDDAQPQPHPQAQRRHARAAPVLLLGSSCQGLPAVSAALAGAGSAGGPGIGTGAGAGPLAVYGRTLSTSLSAEHAFLQQSPWRGPRESPPPRAGASDTVRRQHLQQQPAAEQELELQQEEPMDVALRQGQELKEHGQQQEQQHHAQRRWEDQDVQQDMEQEPQQQHMEQLHVQLEEHVPQAGSPAAGFASQRCGLDRAIAGGSGGGNDVDDDEGDGAMLIDVGTGDRSAEGALLPTPERPRPAGVPAAGWDALRGFSFRGDEEKAAGGAGGDGVFGTLALLSPRAPEEGVGQAQRQTPSPLHPQPAQAPSDGVIAEAEPGRPGLGDRGGGGAVEGLMEGGRGPGAGAGAPAATGGGAGSVAGATEEDGFDADDEAEAGAQEERARGSLRLTSRSSRWRSLPGLSAPPPWSFTCPLPPSSTPAPQQRPGLLASFSSLALAQPQATPPTQAQPPQRQPATYPTAALSHLHLGTAQAAAGVGPMGSGAGSGPASDAHQHQQHQQALEELLKLKCSLRRAVQGQNTRATGLILSLLAGLAVSPQLLADSQVAALVSPLQSSSSAEVAGAARRLVAGWKDVLKAAARRPDVSLAPAPGGRSHVAAGAAAAAAAAAAVAGMDLDGGGSRGAAAAGRSTGPHQHLQPHQEWSPHSSRHLRTSLTSGCGGAGEPLQHPHSHPQHHQALPHRQPRDVDVRDQAEPATHRPPHFQHHARPHRRASALQPLLQRPAAPHDLSLAALSLARSQSDALPGAAAAEAAAAEAEAALAAAATAAAAGASLGAAAAQGGRLSRSEVQPFQVQVAPSQPESQPGRHDARGLKLRSLGQVMPGADARKAAGEGWRGVGAVAEVAPQRPVRSGRAGDDALAGSRTASEPDGGSDGGGDTDGEGGGLRARVGTVAEAAAAAGAKGMRGLRLGGGAGGNGCPCRSDGSGAVSGPVTSYSPVPTPTAAAAAATAALAAGGTAEGAGAADRFRPHSKRCPRPPTCGALGDGSGVAPKGTVPTPAHAPTADVIAPLLEPALLPVRDVSAGVGMGLGFGAGSPGSVLTQPPPPAPPCALSSPAALPLTAAVAGAGALLLPPPGLLAPGSAGRKRKGERPSSRRRSGNPNKRPASGAGLAGPRALHSGTLPMPLSLPLPDVIGPGVAASDDQRLHHGGPLAGVKIPARSSMGLGLGPLNKRQRHHAGAGGAGPSTQGGGGGSATQVRRVSLLLSSLDLGVPAGGAGAGGEDDGEQAVGEQAAAGAVTAAAGVATEGDADADMGSQDDEAAMLTSDDDLLPATAPRGGGGYGGMGSFASWDDSGAALIVVGDPGRGSRDDRDREGTASPPGLGLGLGPGDGGGGGSGSGRMQPLHRPTAGGSASPALGGPAGVGGSGGGGVAG